jgi:hypothetical protein
VLNQSTRNRDGSRREIENMILRPIVVTAEQGGTVRTAVKVEQRLEIVLEGSALISANLRNRS